MREGGTETGVVDTIGTSYLAEGFMRLRADRAKVNRSACPSVCDIDELDTPA
jgi:hypothetical protein